MNPRTAGGLSHLHIRYTNGKYSKWNLSTFFTLGLLDDTNVLIIERLSAPSDTARTRHRQSASSVTADPTADTDPGSRASRRTPGLSGTCRPRRALFRTTGSRDRELPPTSTGRRRFAPDRYSP